MSQRDGQPQLPVIAIGASAGGLEACRALLSDLPADLKAALILILHLDPSHDSMMVDLLAAHTKLKVVQASDTMVLQSGVVHVIPPGYFLTVTDHVLHLSKPHDGKAVRLPFDVLLSALAKDAAGQSVAIILSGTGTDGSLGSAEISAAGGLVIAQDPREASYSGMPESVISSGIVAQTLPIKQMREALETFLAPQSSQPQSVSDKPAPPGDKPSVAKDPSEASYDDILSFMGEHAQQDIALYKRGTLQRRIARRMALAGLGPDETPQYLGMLRDDALERAELVADFLIHVTGFFRDSAVFKHLSDDAIPKLLATVPADRPLRVWVAGCSTGEEAYSLGITALEAMDTAGSGARLQILASDVDPEAIVVARAGFYPKDIEASVSSERLARFFVPEDGGYRVTAALRDVIVFTVADILSDPPFSKMDLVSCRNVLIYLGHEAQKRVIARCCFALRPDGLLLLGAAEMPGPGDRCFALEDKEARLWRRVGQSNSGDLHFKLAKRDDATPPREPAVRQTALAELCRKIVLEAYAPAAVLVNTRLECLYFLGPTEKYLKIAQGHPDPGLLAMLPEGLRSRVRLGASSCSKAKPLSRISGGRIAGKLAYNIEIHAVSTEPEPMLLVCFIDSPLASVTTAAVSTAPLEVSRSMSLEADLEATRSDLSAALRNLEDEVEAHGADIAEALSVNEEFQSTNEELLASKEELQSLNEELTALNSQLQETLERHRTMANDLQNVLYSTDVATLFLDLDLNIRFFTPAARDIFRVIATDVGRPLSDLAAISKDEFLAEDAQAVLASADPIERETAGLAGTWYMRRVQPYRGEAGRIQGIVITYIDITERKRINAALVAAKEEADRATKAKSRFLASASHDLRQPLQSMALLHKLMPHPKRSTKGARLATLLDQTLTSMTAMLDSMLDVHRIDSGIVRPDMRPVPISPLMQRLVDEFEPQAADKGLYLRWVPCSVWVQTDPQMLEQIMRNLLSNALKYTPTGGILLGCRRKGQTIDVLVCDSGVGVPASEMSLIFEAYHQGDMGGITASFGGGLGLSIVQRLADLMDHPISVRSTLGKGSAFIITLPVTEARPAEQPQPDDARENDPAAIPQTGTILLVEDEMPLRGLLVEILTREGHKVIAKTNAGDALAWASSDVPRPDLLLTDFDLRDGSTGLDLAQDLPDVFGAAVPTIILTGDITTETHDSIAGSAYRQMVKPVMPEVLLATASEMMQTDRLARSRATNPEDNSATTIHVIDDDPTIRETTRRLFEAEGWQVVTYPSAEDFLSRPRPGGTACLLIDSLLPGMDGMALITRLRAEESLLPAVMLTGHGDTGMAVAALKAGASDLIEKPASAAELLNAIRQAIKNARDAQILATSRKSAKKRFSSLTAREREILEQILNGAPNKIIAYDLGINQRTVENHRAAIMRKTGARSLPELVRMALAADAPGA